MKHTIKVPSLNFEGTRQLLKELAMPEGTTSVEFDFALMLTVEPFGMLVASRAISMFRADHRDLPFAAVNYEGDGGCSYAAHVGFFKMFGMQFGKNAGEASGSATYIPITSCSIGDLNEEIKMSGERIGDHLVVQGRSLAGVLARTNSGPLYDILAYSIREILRNIVEHSRALSYEFCAQYWPSKNKVEVAILDRGIGVKESLSAHPRLKLTSHRDALNWSLLPGISGKMYEGIHIDPHDPYQNSGFGLFLTSRLCLRYGTFVIGSYDSALGLHKKQTHPFEFGFRGTAVRLVLRTNELPNDVEALLREIIKEGDDLAAKIPEAIKIPNSASKLLRGEFSSGTR